MNIPTGYAQVNCFLTGAALPRGAQITFGVKNNPPLSASDLALITSEVVPPNLMPLLVNTVAMTKIRAKLGPNATGAFGEVSFSTAGSSSSSPCTPQVAVIVKKNTAGGGRTNAGRLFIPGIGEDKVDGAGTVVGSFVTSMNTAWAAILDGMAGNDLDLVLLHGAVEETPTAITGFATEGLAATQRRRIRKVGGRRRRF